MLGDFCDIQFLGHGEVSSNGENEENNFIEIITGFDYEHGLPRTIVVKAIENNSITGSSLKRTNRGDGSIKLSSAIFAD